MPIIHLDQGPESLFDQSSESNPPNQMGTQSPNQHGSKILAKNGIENPPVSHLPDPTKMGFRAKKNKGMNSPVASNRSGHITRIHQPEKLGP